MTRIADDGCARWDGTLELGEGWASWRGVVGDVAPHRHLAAQAVIAATPLRVHDARGMAASGRCILIDPLAPHRLDRGVVAELLFVEPPCDLPPGARARLVDAASEGPTVLVSAGGRRYWADLANVTSSIDPRVERALAAVDGAVGRGRVPLATAARAAGLSSSRLRHLLVDHVGVTHRRYALWSRLRVALKELASGRDLTTAAHHGGFADASHLARTLKGTFGVTAGQVLLGTRSPAAAFKRRGAEPR